MDELAGIFFLSRSVTLRARSKKRVTKFVSDPADPVSEIRMHFEFIRLDVLSRNIRERRSIESGVIEKIFGVLHRVF